jgi:ribosomal protein S18 acetylase RimI-like enzyme
MTAYSVGLLTPQQARARRLALVDLLVDAVEGGASVGFVWPMTRAKAETWWEDVLASHARGERLIFAAETDGHLAGTVQLIPSPKENQAFRADLTKLLVRRSARRRGLGVMLMRAAEDEARRIGRTLLTLDTETGSAAERLYTRLGWTKYGEIPAYATSPDGRSRDPVSFCYKVL